MIVKNDSGIKMQFTINENGAPIDLTGMTVDVIFKNGDYRIEKVATITEPKAGQCEVEITADETTEDGILDYQVQVENAGTNARYSSQVEHIAITEAL